MTSAYPRTDILLPYKEVMTPSHAGAIARVAADLYHFSAYSEKLKIFGSPISGQPLKEVNFQPLSPRHKWLFGNNKGFLRAYLAYLRAYPGNAPSLVEIHSRCHLAREMKTARPDLNVSLYMHNDARDMQGGKTIKERLWLVNNLSAILFVSDYLRQRFITDLPAAELLPNALEKCSVIANEVTRTHSACPKKKKQIILAGRMVPEKGILEACEAAAQILPAFPDWQLHVVGGTHFHKAAPSEYEKKIMAALAPLGAQATQHGYLEGSRLSQHQADAALAIVPSIWQEPAGLTVMEALAHGCALLTTDKGGIPETATGRAEIAAIGHLDRNAPKDREKIIQIFAEKLEDLLSHPEQIHHLQDKAWHNYPYDARNMAVNADRCRLCINS